MSASSARPNENLSYRTIYTQFLSDLSTDNGVIQSQREKNQYPFNKKRLLHAENAISELRKKWQGTRVPPANLSVLNLYNIPIDFTASKEMQPVGPPHELYVEFKPTITVALTIAAKVSENPGKVPPTKDIPSPLDIKSRPIEHTYFRTNDHSLVVQEYRSLVDQYIKADGIRLTSQFQKVKQEYLGEVDIVTSIYFPAQTLANNNELDHVMCCRLEVVQEVTRTVFRGKGTKGRFFVRKPAWIHSLADEQLLAYSPHPKGVFIEDIQAFTNEMGRGTIVFAIEPDISVCDILANMEPQFLPSVLVCSEIVHSASDATDSKAHPIQRMIAKHYLGIQWEHDSDWVLGKLWIYIRKNDSTRKMIRGLVVPSSSRGPPPPV